MTSADQEFADWLNDYLDARLVDDELPSDLERSMVETVQRFFARDDVPAPPPELEQRIGDELMNQALSRRALSLETMTLSPPFLNGHALPGLGQMGPDPGALRILNSRIARYAIAAILLLSLGLGYAGYDRFRAEPGGPSMVPAAIQPAATPEAVDFSEADHPIVGAWLWDMEAWDPGNNIHYGIFDPDGTFTGYEDFSGIYVGTWRATGERTAELVFIVQHPIVLETQSEPGFPLPESVFTGDAFTSWITIEVDESGNSFVASGYYEPRTASGNVIVHLEYDSVDGNTLAGTRLAPVTVASEATPAP